MLHGPLCHSWHGQSGDGNFTLSTPLPLVIEGRAVAAMHRLKVGERWRNFDSDGRRSLNSHVRALQLAEEHFDVLLMPSDIIPTKKV